MPALPTGGIRYFRKYLFDVPLVDMDWSRGMVKDIPRNQIPVGGSEQLTDFFTDRPGMLYKRGGTTYQSSLLADHSDVDVIAIMAPEYPGDPRVLAITSDSVNTWLYDITTATHGTAIALGQMTPFENPPLYPHSNFVIITDGLGVHIPKKAYLNAGVLTVADLGGNPPKARCSVIHEGRLVLASTLANPNRVFFGPATSAESDDSFAITGVSTGSKTFTVAGDVTTTYGVANTSFNVWGSTGNNGTYTVVSATFTGGNTVITVKETIPSAVANGFLGIGWSIFSYLDFDEQVMGLASIQGVLLVFGRGTCQRVNGNAPPSQYGTDFNMVVQPLGNVGCIDARTIQILNNEVYFANESGVFTTNGAGFVNLTNKKDSTGISSLWQDRMEGFSPALGAVVAGGAYLDQYYLVSILHNSGARSSFLYYLPNTSWVEMSAKTGATMYATSYAPTTELYAGSSVIPGVCRALKLSGMWSPSATNKNDADGTPVTPLWIARGFMEGAGMKRFGFGHLTYDMRDAASDNPTLEISLATGIEADSSFADTRESPLAETTASKRRRFTLYKDSQALNLLVQQNNASAKTEFYALELEVGIYFVADGN